jgi:hypothetical protein
MGEIVAYLGMKEMKCRRSNCLHPERNNKILIIRVGAAA